MAQQKMRLVLQNGLEFAGYSFGYHGQASGEVVFNTSMTGYPESLTDPSYCGQILVATFPLIGNFGVPSDERVNGISKYFESDKIHISGMVVNDYSMDFSHWNADRSLSDWLIQNKIPAIGGVDTRALTILLREHGAMPGILVPEQDNTPLRFADPNHENLASRVASPEKIIYGNGSKRVVVVDCGVKNNIIRCLLARNTTVVRVPWDYDFTAEKYDGLFLSNGPGDPKQCKETIFNLRKAFSQGKPVFGICLGSQIMALAAGADTYKLKYGHRGHNQPVRMEKTNRCFITSQNHGYAVDVKTLPYDWEPLFTNLNDGTNEGIKHKRLPFFSTQFHPEASSGPTDTEFLFDWFIQSL